MIVDKVSFGRPWWVGRNRLTAGRHPGGQVIEWASNTTLYEFVRFAPLADGVFPSGRDCATAFFVVGGDSRVDSHLPGNK